MKLLESPSLALGFALALWGCSGPQGTPGAGGPSGQAGPTGPTGATGPAGVQGNDGISPDLEPIEARVAAIEAQDLGAQLQTALGRLDALERRTTAWRVIARTAGPGDINLGDAAIPANNPRSLDHGSIGLTVGPRTSAGANVRILCDGEIPTGTTCSTTNERIGLAFEVPQAGLYRVCVDYTLFQLMNGTGSAMDTYLLLAELDPRSGVTLALGETELHHRVENRGNVNQDIWQSQQVNPTKLCDYFEWTAPGERAVALMYYNRPISTAPNGTNNYLENSGTGWAIERVLE
ncbi:MAG: collagen-like protein [Deltaproteobacteria bacterium]|nr:collagen-like protein [Deltaproteobacteria bacterium]